MFRPTLLIALAVGLSSVSLAFGQKHELVKSKDGRAIGYKTTPIQPWSGFHVHDPDRPIPRRVDPGPAPPPMPVPSDAVVLFDGTNLDAWKPHKWQLDEGLLVAGEGNLTSQAEFGACQLHLEWQAPAKPDENWGNCGNNGVMLLGLFEIQIYDSHTMQIYPDGQAASIYAQTPPLVNATRKPGEWQSFDIVLKPPVYEGEKLVEKARVTMHHNGVLVHHHQEVHGSTPHLRLAEYGAPTTRGPIILMGHHCPVKFRNIWVRSLEE